LYGCEIWYFAIKEQHRFKVCENSVPRKVFGFKCDEVTGGLRKLHNEELHNLYPSPNVIMVIKSMSMRRVGHVARMGEMTYIYEIFFRNLK
jgi:hypothetical protein